MRLTYAKNHMLDLVHLSQLVRVWHEEQYEAGEGERVREDSQLFISNVAPKSEDVHLMSIPTNANPKYVALLVLFFSSYRFFLRMPSRDANKNRCTRK